MKTQDRPHLFDERLLLYLDGELSSREAKQVQSHLDACWSCRARRSELDQTISKVAQLHRSSLKAEQPPAEGPRALFRARLAELSNAPPPRFFWFYQNRKIAWAVAILSVVVGASAILSESEHLRLSRKFAIVAQPDSRLTPGATVLMTRMALCSSPDMKNKAVPANLQRQVFDEYGIGGADPAAYEVDYLVTPALGGADDIHNLWPHSYSATVWNARVKDELEDRLRDMVCDGSIELAAAQQQIATDWIAAYKKHFHTDQPLERYCRRCAP